jgi:hypothetical protein
MPIAADSGKLTACLSRLLRWDRYCLLKTEPFSPKGNATVHIFGQNRCHHSFDFHDLSSAHNGGAPDRERQPCRNPLNV